MSLVRGMALVKYLPRYLLHSEVHYTKLVVQHTTCLHVAYRVGNHNYTIMLTNLETGIDFNEF